MLNRLTPPQAEVLRSNILGSGFNCLLQMPTGSGKTWLAEYAIESAIDQNRRAIYLAPTRALALEIFSRWNQRFIGKKIGIFTGDFGNQGNSYPVPFEQANVLIMTPERLDACTRNWRTHWSWLPEVDLLVVDEFHLIGESSRGARLEGCLGRFRRLNPFARVLGLSATLGNREELADWLNAVDFAADWRPIPLTWRIVHFKKADEKPLIAFAEISRVVKAGGKSLVFVQSRRRAEILADFLRLQGLNATYHHAGLDLSERQQVETNFRNHLIDVLVTTATLEVGINLPVRQVVLYDLQSFDGYEYNPLQVNQVWQRVGRAGRPGLDTEGEAVLIAPGWHGREAQKYQLGKFESINSCLAEYCALTEQIVAEISSGLCRSRNDLKTALALSLAAHQTRLPLLDPLINDLCQSGLLNETINTNTSKPKLLLKATPLGRIVTRLMLAPSTLLLFQRMLHHKSPLTFFDLLLVAAASEDCEPILQVDYEELSVLSEHLSNQPSSLLLLGHQSLSELLGINGLRLLSAIKVALVIRARTRQADLETLTRTFNCYAFEINRLRDSMERLLSAMSCCVKITGNQEEAELHLEDDIENLSAKITALQSMINAGLDEITITLTLIPGLGPKFANRLAGLGICDIEDLAQCDPEDVTNLGGVSLQRASRWIKSAEELMHDKTFRYFEESQSAVTNVECIWPQRIDPYRVKRALELKVTQLGDSCYQVTGGSDPHRVELESKQLHCDCLDSSKGNICKHLIAVNLSRNDLFFVDLRNQLLEKNQHKFDLLRLWLDSGKRLRIQ
jgi:helicase